MMERNYPSSNFTEPVTAAAQSAGWAYKPSSNYDSTLLDSELLQRQTFASSHQPPTFSTSHHPTEVFDSNQHSITSSITTESSVMNFLSAIESRSLQAGPAGSALLPPFRSPSWQTGANTSTELFLTGALHPSETFQIPSALSSHQHTSAFPTRSFTTTSALAVQDSPFSSSNGLLSHNDPLLQLKSTQSTVPTALAFDRLSGASIGAGLPPQSSTYRSAQESAPHLLQPQFSLLPTALGTSQQAPQPYSAPVFSGSIERAFQRECSVIKHLQRPSSTQPVQEQLAGGIQHSLQGYLHDDSDVSYQQDPSPHTPLPCSPVGDPLHTVNGSAQQKTSQAALQQAQAYASVSSPGFSGSSGVKVKDGSSKIAQHPSESTDTHAQASSPALQQQSYASQAQKQSSVIASQSQPYTSAHLLPGLLSVSASHAYVTSQSLTSNLSQTQAFSSSLPEKLPSIYKTLSSFASQSEAETSVSQSFIYSSSQHQDLPSPGNREGYDTQVQTLCMGSPSQSYSSTRSQGLPTISFYTQAPASSSIPSQNFVSVQPLTPSPTFSPSHVRTLSANNPTQDYILMQPSPSSKADSALLQQNYLLSVQASTSSPATHTQALKDDQSSVELKTAYGKSEQDERMFLSSKEDSGELPIEDVQALQKGSIGSSPQTLARNEIGVQNNVVYVLSKMEDRQNTQSVIRSNSRSEEQIVGLTHLETTKDEKKISPRQYTQLATSANSPSHLKSNPLLMQSTHAPLSADQLKQQTLLLKESSSQQQNHQSQMIRVQQAYQRQLSEDQTPFIRVPSAQVLLEPSHMIVLQQPVLASGQNQPKKTMYMQSVPVQYLQTNCDTISLTVNGCHNQQIIPHQVTNSAESTKQDPPQKDNFSQSNPHDTKHNFTLSSVCFPESMLLADERHILSNVDDILAATAAACGVTPQDFVKSTSSDGDLSSIASPTDSKCHFQTVENRLNSFPSQNVIMANSQTMTINGAQMSYPKDEVFMLSNSLNQQDVSNNSAQEFSDKVASSYEKNNVLPKEHFVKSSNDSALNANGLTNSNTASSDLQLDGQKNSPSGHVNNDNPSNNKGYPKGTEGIKTDDGPTEHPTDGLPKKRSRSKGSSKQTAEDENGQHKPQKRSTQAKRLNSRASDASSTSTSEGCHDNYQQQERMRQKIKEVEEKQPEVKTGFLGSFLDFLKSGPRQQLSSPPIRSPSRSRKPSASKRPPNPSLIPLKSQPPSTPLISPDPHSVISTKRHDEDLQRNLETLPSFSSDEDDSVGKNQDLQKSITSALSSLDEPSDEKQKLGNNTKQVQASSMQPTNAKLQEQQKSAQNMSAEELVKDVPHDKLAVQLTTVAIEGLMDEEMPDSGGEGMYRERDEFVVKNEDIERLQITLKAGVEPPAIWKVQKALLQKFVPELRDGKRVFFATNSYLGYFGDAKSMYRRVHVKFLDTVNKREYVRVCSRKPRTKAMLSLRCSQAKALLAQRFTAVTVSDTPTQKTLSKPRPKQPKAKAEPPPKKRKKWKEGFTMSPSDSSPEAVSEDDEFTPPVPFASRFLNTRTMKETFKSFVELLIGVALDADVINALERENDELLLPHMKRVDGMITDNRRRLLPKLRMGQIFKNALDSFPELSVVNELKTDCETPIFKMRLSGRAYNRKTMKPSKSPSKLPLEYTVDQQKTKWFSLYHSLQHYKYHTYLMCMEEIELLKSRGKDLGQDEMVQTCMGNRAWVEGLFDHFGELLSQVQQACL
ncbi:glutamine and serine-rich protein 1-like isoform X1 [Myxocyprinus asiaticus]|uniref:glutamine and serine-rich protein 1-like isoform X1 n=1 Tax=Myxocyprinus asiaticus TaxID=70543 RepID=UPI0022217A4A|nr:glutamine and serine-rich protein 1-like isoform X1 [Myxocyprinus asiaticus]